MLHEPSSRFESLELMGLTNFLGYFTGKARGLADSDLSGSPSYGCLTCIISGLEGLLFVPGAVTDFLVRPPALAVEVLLSLGMRPSYFSHS